MFSMDFQSEMKSTALNGNKDVKMLGAASASTLRKKGRFKKYIARNQHDLGHALWMNTEN